MEYVSEVLKGMVIGVANIMPGVSGSALAVSMGVYDQILSAISQVLKDTKRSIKTLLPYVIGAVSGVLGLSFVIEWLFEVWPLQTNLTFIGLILGGIPAVSRRAVRKDGKKSSYLILFAAFALAVLMGCMERTEGIDVILTLNVKQVVILYALGIVGAFSMIVPGVSGTMIFMMLGYYRPLLALINGFVRAAAVGDLAGAWICSKSLIPLGLGIMTGMFLCAKVLLWLFERYESVTYSAILGLVLSSPMVILSAIPWSKFGLLDFVTGMVFFAAALFATLRFGDEN
ncbi:DUF368 domain-containing protein [Clostridium sp. chh4-2]|uniref:DUF368 domain-containing protein n=1 Tax=Clostridium sp. chh4-2 TaxID=2067550 RepID=UPI000CCF55F9|nr:DUF368 domain-containing protein [Clostridium sp. chh4-2]PNV61059.1 DUF368 domain-containing protein [Clostridium sp. chh4-2]